MQKHVIEACTTLYARIARYQSRNHWLTEQAEEALNELVNHTDRTSPSHHLVRNTLSNARQKLIRRAGLLKRYLQMQAPEINEAIGEPVVEISLAPLIKHMHARDVHLLELAASGLDAEEIAAIVQSSVRCVQKRLSRARSQARIIREMLV